MDLDVIGNRPPRDLRTNGRPGNRMESQSLDRAQLQAATGALRVEAASQAQADKEAIAAAVPSDLEATLSDYEARISALESP